MSGYIEATVVGIGDFEGACPQGDCADGCVDITQPPDPVTNPCGENTLAFNGASGTSYKALFVDFDWTGSVPFSDVSSIILGLRKTFPMPIRLAFRANHDAAVVLTGASGDTIASLASESGHSGFDGPNETLGTVPAGTQWLLVTVTAGVPITFVYGSALNLCRDFEYPAP